MQTDESLRSIRAGLVAREAELRDRLQRVQKDLRREVTPLPRDAPDAAVVMENDEILQAVEETSQAELKQLERALERLEAGTYGVCEDCGAQIERERLKVVPYASQCRHCAADA